MDLIIDEITESGTLILTGELTVNHAALMRDQITCAMRQVKALKVDTRQAREVDLSFLQLLCSAHRTATTLNKTFELTEESRAALQKAVDDNGYRRDNGCVPDVAKTCLWVEIKNE